MQKRIHHYILLLVLFIVPSPLFAQEGRGPLHIAFAGPLSGVGAENGTAMLRGIRLYLDDINKQGGIAGRNIVLDQYDDRNDPEVAVTIAQEIAKQNRALAVIGHFYSSCSLAAGPLYQGHAIPAISPGSTHPDVTRENPFYFRTIPNDQVSASFLAHYIKEVLGLDRINVIHEEQQYGAFLSQAFVSAADNLGLAVTHRWSYSVTAPDLEQSLSQIVYTLKQEAAKDALFMAVQAPEGILLLKRLREAGIDGPIIGPTSFSSPAFADGFDNFPEEKAHPGYFTEGIYTANPLIFYAASTQAQQFQQNFESCYGETPRWPAAFAYDAIMLAVRAIQQSDIKGNIGSIRRDRLNIKQYLANLTSAIHADEGVTGYTYFDEHGDVAKPLMIGIYKKDHLIAAPTQLRPIPTTRKIPELEKALVEKQVFEIDGQYLARTAVVSTGIEIESINEVNTSDMTYHIDFYLWFRYQGDLPIDAIEFLYAQAPITLSDPIQETKTDGVTYRLYRVQGVFKVNYYAHPFSGKYLLNLAFQHRNLGRDNLIYVPDVIGMDLAEKSKSLNRTHGQTLINPTEEWSLDRVRVFQDIVAKNTLGSPAHIELHGQTTDFSRFNTEITATRKSLTLRGTISAEASMYILVFGLIFLAAVGAAGWYPRTKPFVKTLLLLQAIAVFMLLISAEVKTLVTLMQENNVTVMHSTKLFFDILWWLIPAFFVNKASEHLLWVPLETKAQRTIPKIVRRFVAFIVYLIAVCGIIAFVYHRTLTSLLATSGVVAMIIGLAIQINISNIFSGIAIHLERPFRVGDWIEIKGMLGKVIDMTWRTIRIQTAVGNIVCIPNSVASESTLTNYNYPDDSYYFGFTIHIEPAYSPDRVKKILTDAILSYSEVQAPWVRFCGLKEWSADYWVFFCVRDYGLRNDHLDAVWTRVWTALHRAGIKPAVQRQELDLFRGQKARDFKDAIDPITLLNEIELFSPFSGQAKQELSQRMHRRQYEPEETIIQQGDEGDSLFIIVEGVVKVVVNLDDGKSLEVARLGAGSFFGEMALLTGEARTATIQAVSNSQLYEITKTDIAPLISLEPHIAHALTDVLTERKLATASKKEKGENAAEIKKSFSRQILKNLQRFFGLKNQSE
ncbi:MAG: ABC transporter substrate-binding protein [Phycisphaerae bacterium]|nr:ABC transporter substrate-binding protein [Phycisphaerae bacterium]